MRNRRHGFNARRVIGGNRHHRDPRWSLNCQRSKPLAKLLDACSVRTTSVKWDFQRTIFESARKYFPRAARFKGFA